MKLLRYGPAGHELPGALDERGQVRALRPVVRDIDESILSAEGIAFLEAVDLTRLPIVAAPGRLGAPFTCARQIIAIGLNYRDHAIEAKLPIPEQPVVFTKSVGSICGPDDDIILPPDSTETDWEIELGIVIGTKASRIDKDQARAHVAGFCMVNDVSERDWQMKKGGQWGKGKSFDTFSPVGPWLVTRTELTDPHALQLKLSVNGQQMQNGSTADLIFDVDVIVSYVSQFMTLFPGDLIITGTPAGVGLGMNPQRFLSAGDVIDMTITGLGAQRHTVVAAAG
jgi:2-keto-4-pentenoate hydratase/2-oxohepta-3-ene-1,7-dioic acid hydratase in catechol pathway